MYAFTAKTTDSNLTDRQKTHVLQLIKHMIDYRPQAWYMLNYLDMLSNIYPNTSK